MRRWRVDGGLPLFRLVMCFPFVSPFRLVLIVVVPRSFPSYILVISCVLEKGKEEKKTNDHGGRDRWCNSYSAQHSSLTVRVCRRRVSSLLPRFLPPIPSGNRKFLHSSSPSVSTMQVSLFLIRSHSLITLCLSMCVSPL